MLEDVFELVFASAARDLRRKSRSRYERKEQNLMSLLKWGSALFLRVSSITSPLRVLTSRLVTYVLEPNYVHLLGERDWSTE